MALIHIVLNLARKEFWIADLQYHSKIEEYVNRLKAVYGENDIQFYSTDSKHLQKDIETEEYRGFKQAHYIDWI